MSCPTVETERLILRPFVDADVDAYDELMHTSEVREALFVPDSFDRTESWNQMARWLGQWSLRSTGHWAVEERASARMIGHAGSHRPERDDWPGIEIGWTLHPDVWGQGYATEAGRATIDWVFANHEVGAVYSVILPSNPRSEAVAARLGFRLEATRTLSHFPRSPHGIWRLDRR